MRRSTKYGLLWCSLVLCASMVKGQQRPIYSQDMFNPVVINPAAAGMTDQLIIDMGYRQQWIGVDGAPQTYYLAADMGFYKKYNHDYVPLSLRTDQTMEFIDETEGDFSAFNRVYQHGVALTVHSDHAGAFTNNIITTSYTLHIPFSRRLKLSVGTSFGLTNSTLDGTNLTVVDEGDLTFAQYSGAKQQTNVGDLGAGVYLYHSKFQFGASATKIARIPLGGNLNLSNSIEGIVHGGYNIRLGDESKFTPSAIVRYTENAPLSIAGHLMFDVQDKFWVGAGYRLYDAVLITLRFKFADRLILGYSYDYSLSPMSTYNTGTHEAHLGARLF